MIDVASYGYRYYGMLLYIYSGFYTRNTVNAFSFNEQRLHAHQMARCILAPVLINSVSPNGQVDPGSSFLMNNAYMLTKWPGVSCLQKFNKKWNALISFLIQRRCVWPGAHRIYGQGSMQLRILPIIWTKFKHGVQCYYACIILTRNKNVQNEPPFHCAVWRKWG